MLDGTPADAPFVLLPTARQLEYARKLALRNQTVLPWKVQKDRQTLSQWIEAQASQRPAQNERPSSKQVAFAERIARIRHRDIPDECFRSRELMSRWIDCNRP